ncbi:beta-mannosidase-like isoform X1 [Lytechinus pictus]|uniref:beta-mannosidase-like isoform X1 n=2 Tax=Lytechinus pictus TaxID=7653 RepID=UPI0030B9F1D7
MLFFILIVLASCWLQTNGELTFDLNGQWKLTNSNGSISIPGQVPGSVHTDLISSGILSDPYYRFNDDLYKWVGRENWTYTHSFTVPSELVKKHNVKLVSKGLDTIANITLNGIPVGSSTNMFVRHVWDVTPVLKVGENIIQVAFESPITFSATRFSSYPYDVPPDCPPPVQHGFCHPNFIRKEQSSFSWDWGPGFAPIGIWKDIYLEAFDDPILRDVTAISYESGNSVSEPPNPGWLNITMYFDLGNLPSNESINATVLVWFPTMNYTKIFDIEIDIDHDQISKQVFVPKAELWYPHGYGSQTLYPLNVTLKISRSGETSSRSMKVGFRNVELVQEKIANSTGLSFYFKINNIPIFIKGSNWIPADAFQERITRSNLTGLLQSAIDANIHALRVWGGGVYERDEFYELCDELGIIVWQDFMFACAMYPVDEVFRSSVAEEVHYQVRRLSSHPSIIAWSANNENEKALRKDWYDTSRNFTRYENDYIALYIGVIREIVLSQATGLPFMSSSPSNGLLTEMQGWVAKDPSSVYYGDVHYYNYSADCWDVSSYPKPRFASEYGVQSWPSFRTLGPVSIATDWSYSSAFSNHRQHHMFGQAQILAQIQRHFNLPSSKDHLVYFKDLLYLTQVSQALCIKFETEHYRRLQSILVDGQGHCMGALYWQLNDIWQAPSWSSIEYGGQWKMLHYYVKDFFSPILASGMIQDEELYGYSVTETDNLVDASFVTSIWSWTDLKPKYQVTNQFSQNALSSKMVLRIPLDDLLQKAACGSNPLPTCFVTMVIYHNNSTQLSPINPLFLSSFSDVIGLKKPVIRISSVSKVLTDEFLITLKTSSIAPFTWLDSGGLRGRFSQNGFLMMTPSISVTFFAWESMSTEELANSLTVSSLMDLY